MRAGCHRWPLAALLLALLGCGGGGDRAREVARVRQHLERVVRELEASPPPTLTAAQAERRALAIDNLRRYIEAERYPTNDTSRMATPIFVDRHGARCAMAALIETTGGHAVVARIARTRNLAYVRELGRDPDLVAWLDENGVTLDEAARIQPKYGWNRDSEWQPTAAAVVGVNAGVVAGGSGAEIIYAPGIRLGARRVTAEQRGFDSLFYSTALVAEYNRFVAGASKTHLLGLLVQHDLGTDRDNKIYVSGGPVASIDNDANPGFGIGGQVGLGMSFRGLFGLLGEVVAAAMGHGQGATLRGGLNFGVVW